MKKCPYCAEEIQDEAIFCRFCGHELQTAPLAAQGIKPGVSKTNKSLEHLLFSAEGRIPRSTYWYYNLSMFGLGITAFIADALLNTQDSNSGYGWFYTLFALMYIITAICVDIKRCHDLNWSGWHILFALVPFAGLVVAIYWAFVKGTVGPNKYGPDPTQ